VHARSATLAGSRARWLEAGAGDAVVLVHGLGNNAQVWRQVIPALARRHRVLAPDLPGFGRSSPSGTRGLLRAYAQFVAALVEREAGGRAALVGNSVGGAVVLRVALERPELVSRLVLVDPAGVGQGVPDWWRLVRIEGLVRAASAIPLTLMPRPLLRWGIGQAYRHMAFADPRRPSDRSVAVFTGLLGDRARIHRLLRGAHDIVTSFEREVQSLEHPLTVPVLAVWGRQDRLVPLHDALALLERIDDVELRIIDDCGHSPQLEQPEAFLDAVGDFLVGRWSPPVHGATRRIRLQDRHRPPGR
jgi:pimeloyl-ACP methyl ester carboxylesterase